MRAVFTNLCSLLLDSPAADTDTTLTVSLATGDLPAPSLLVGNYFPLVCMTGGDPEIVYVTSYTGTGPYVLTVTRAQEGTVAQPLSAGISLDLNITAEVLESLMPSDDVGGIYTAGVLSTNRITLTGAKQSPEGYVVTIRSTSGATHELTLPTDDTSPVLWDGENVIRDNTVPDDYPVGAIIHYAGTYAAIPSNWKLCDGAGGTPDLRDCFVVGAAETQAINRYPFLDFNATIAGSNSSATSSAGGHTHGIASNSVVQTQTARVSPAVLTPAQMPTHTHKWASNINYGTSLWLLNNFLYLTGGNPANIRYTWQPENVMDLAKQAYPNGNGSQWGYGGFAAAGVANPAAHDHVVYVPPHAHGTLYGSAADGSHSHTVDTQPNHYAFAYIIKVR